jgi:hypothetical protein
MQKGDEFPSNLRVQGQRLADELALAKSFATYVKTEGPNAEPVFVWKQRFQSPEENSESEEQRSADGGVGNNATKPANAGASAKKEG